MYRFARFGSPFATGLTARLTARLATHIVLPCIGVALLTSAAQAATTNVGVSVSINQPGFYGRIDIGDQPPPVIYAQPVIIQQGPMAIHQRPIYLRVPPGHSRDWARYCGRYHACGQPVFFVRDDGRDGHRGDRRDPRRGEQEERGGEHGERGRGHGHGHH